jgi:hypothetical protein
MLSLFTQGGADMDLFIRLAAAARRQHSEGELPDFMLVPLLQVAEHPERFADKTTLVAELLEQVEQYETYSNVCCEKIGFSIEDLQRTLKRLEAA